MFGIGMQELLVIGIVALLIVGPKKLPDLARTLGKSLNAFRKTADDLTDDIKDTVKAYDDTEQEKSSPVAEFYDPQKEDGNNADSSAPLSEQTSNATESSADTKPEVKAAEE